MSVSSNINTVSYTAAATTFQFEGHFFEASDLVVSVDGVVSTDWSISGTQVDNAYPNGADVVFGTPMVGAESVVIDRQVPLTQPDDYGINGRIEPVEAEKGFDRATVQVQQAEAKAVQAPYYLATDTNKGTVQIPADVALRAGFVLGWDSTGAQVMVGLTSTAAPDVLVAATVAGTDTYTATPSPAITAYSQTSVYILTFTNANTGSATLNINGAGALAIKKNNVALVANDITAGQTLIVIYDGTEFELISDNRETTAYISPTVTAITASATLTADGRTYTNEAAAGQVIGTLPTAVAGLEVEVIVQAAQNFRILTASGDTIRLGNRVTKTAGYIESTTIGDMVKLRAINATEWLAVDGVGTWTVETS
jgi:hypothetical protein